MRQQPDDPGVDVHDDEWIELNAQPERHWPRLAGVLFIVLAIVMVLFVRWIASAPHIQIISDYATHQMTEP
jgi:hypothetical protein